MYKIVKFTEPMSYESVLKMQMNALEKVKNKEYKGIILILQHLPTYTTGSGGGWDNLLYPIEYFKNQGIELIETKRGGNITFHGPGQIVMYPILDLTELKKDVHWYIQSMEESVIRLLKKYEIIGYRKPEYRGVWVGDKKMSAVGVAIERWVTYHGISLNINVDKKYFDWINPCGIKEFGICSLEDYVTDTDINCVLNKMVECFEEVFQIKLQEENQLLFEN